MILLSDQDKQPLSHQAIDHPLCSRDQRLKDRADQASNRPPLTARRCGNKRALQPAGLDKHQRTGRFDELQSRAWSMPWSERGSS